jgi:hypothetical protein
MLLEVNRSKLDMATWDVTFHTTVYLIFAVNAKLRSEQTINIHSVIQSIVFNRIELK